MKKVISVLLSVFLCFSVCAAGHVGAAESVSVSLNSVSVQQGQTVVMSLEISNNTGIAGLIITIGYDETALKLTDIANGGLFDNAAINKNIVFSNNSGLNTTEDGTLARLTFSADETTVPADYPVVVTVHECVDENMNDVNCSAFSGVVSVVCAHQNQEEVSGSAPACTTAGLTAGFRCVDCGAWIVPQEEIPPLGHDYTGEVIPATCTTRGYTKYTCVRGDDEYRDDYVEPIPHVFSILQADATQHWYTCAYGCGTVSEKTAHFGGEATCAEKAYCVECGTPYGEPDPNLHTGETYVKDQKDATHFEKGYTGDIYCAGCNALLEKGTETETTGHVLAAEWSFDEEYHWKECTLGCGMRFGKEPHEGEATCTEKAVCSVCGKAYGEALGHSYTVLKSDGEYHWYECANGCGTISGKVKHSGGAATCTAKATCSVCGKEYGEALGHSYTVLRSFNEYHWYACANGCGTISGREMHSGGAATCTEKAKCAVCGSEYGEALGHSYTVLKSDGEYHWYECANGCGTISGREKHYGGFATCTESAKCAFCGTVYAEASGHSFGAWKETKAPTCTEKGEVVRACSRCDVTETKAVDALGHDFSVLQSDGQAHWYVCARDCGTISGREAHQFGDWITDVPATAAQEGSAYRDCSVCRYREEKTLPKESEDLLFGDIDRDGKVTAADARLALRRAVDLEDYKEGSYEFLVGNVDFDDKITASDARLILRAAVALEDPEEWLAQYYDMAD